MAEYILKDSRGKEQTFADDKIFVQGTDGELVQFTTGTGEAVLENLEVTENGTYTPGEGVDGFGSVVVDVDPTKITILKEQTFTGFAPNSELNGLYFKEVALDTGVAEITIGQDYSVLWDSVEYSVTALDASSAVPGAVFLGNGSILGLSGNGEPFAIGYMGNAFWLISITETVESHSVGIYQKVAGSGGGSLPAGVYLEIGKIFLPNQYLQRLFYYNGDLYALTNTIASAGDGYNVFKYSDGSWVSVISSGSKTGFKGAHFWSYVEFDGKIHLLGCESKKHFVFDGTTISTLNANIPNNIAAGGVFVQDNTLKAYSYYDGIVYAWDKSTDTWTVEATVGLKYNYIYFYFNESEVYATNQKTLYRYENGVLTEIATLTKLPAEGILCDSCLVYYVDRGTTKGYYSELYRYDLITGVETLIGICPYGDANGALYNIQNNLYFQFGDDDAKSHLALLHEISE